MEGCPRSLMLKLDLKESQITSFSSALKRYIREFYQEDGETYSQECSQLEQLRTAVIKPTYDNSGCNLLRKYYGQIHLLKTRFPMGEGSAASVEFTWTDLYTEDPITIPDITYEMSSILFNLGALHSLLASREDRVSEEGMKVACTHYQSAAGAFTYIKENFNTDQYSDTSKELLSLYINVMLGQAQECLLEKSMLDNRKNSLVARIAMQVQNYYTEAIACLTSSFGEILPPRMHKHWSKTLQIKCAYLNALAYMYMGNTSDEQAKYGEKVAFMKIAAQKINEAHKLLKNQGQQMQEVVQFITDVITQKLDGAKRDNDFIYHEPEPTPTALPEIKGASLVKPIPFQPYDPSMGKDIFEKLIPMKAHESSSLYSEEKANLLRRYASIVSEKDKELSSWLASMHIDDLLRPEEADNLPSDLTTKCESLQSNPGALKKSIEMLAKLKEKGTELEKSLEETRKEIIDVQNEKKTFVEKYGMKQDEDIKFKEFLDEVNGYQQKHMDAKKTNDELEKAFEAHRHNLELMIGPEQALHGILPSQNILDSPIDDDAVQRIRDLLAKIEKMKTQRSQLMDGLREQVNKDDITHLIATRNGDDLQSLFKEELKKHDESCEYLQCNLDAQEKIMKALTEANAKYAHARKSVAEIKAKRDVVVKSLIGSYDFFLNFKDKVSSGVTFYNQMSEIFEKRRQEICTICKNEKERLQKILEKAKQIKEERERKSQSKIDPALSSNIPPERRNNPGNPQQPPGDPAGYPSQLGHIPRHPLSLQTVPHPLRGPAPNQHPPIQPGQPGQFTPSNLPPSQSHGQNTQPRMSQYIPRTPSSNLITGRPIMSYPHPPFTSTSAEGPLPPTSLPWRPIPPSRPGDTPPTGTSYIRFPPPRGARPANVPQGPSSYSSLPQQYPGRPPLPIHVPHGQTYQHSQVGNDRGNWQPRGPQQFSDGTQFGSSTPNPSRPPPPHMIPQQPVMPSGQPLFPQRPPSQIIQRGQPQHLPQQPIRPETPPSPQKIRPLYQSQPPSYQEQFGIVQPPAHLGPVRPQLSSQHGPQHLQALPQQQPGPYQNPIPGMQSSVDQQSGPYQQTGQQLMPNQSRSHQILAPYQQRPPVQLAQPSQQQPLQHQITPGYRQAPPQRPQQLGPPPPQPGQQPSGPYHQRGPYQQRFPYQPHQQPGTSHHEQQANQLGQQTKDQRGPPGSPLGRNQQPLPQIPPVQMPPPTYNQVTPTPALEQLPYQKQLVSRKLSAENLPNQRQLYQPFQAHERAVKPEEPTSYSRPQENVPYQTQQLHSYPIEPTQTTDKMATNPSENKRSEKSSYNQAQTSETQYPSQLQAPSSQQHVASEGDAQNKSSYIDQQWQQRHQYGPILPQPPRMTQYPQIHKVAQDSNISKHGGYPTTSIPSSQGVPSAYPLPTSSDSVSKALPEIRSSRQSEFSPSKQAIYPSSTSSSQSIPAGSNVTSTYRPSSSSHNFTQTQQETQIDRPPNKLNPNPSLDAQSPYFPAVSTQASQPYSKENQLNENVSANTVSSVDPNFHSKPFHDFRKVVLSKPGALSVNPLPVHSSTTAPSLELANVSTPATVPTKPSNVNPGGDSYGRMGSIEYSRTVADSLSSRINSESSVHLNIIKPDSSIEDKLLENLKSLDSPQPLTPKQPMKLNDEESATPQIVPSVPELGSNDPRSNIPGSRTTGGNNPVLNTQDLDPRGLDTAHHDDMHKLQQKVLLQQQQLIEQQQRFLEQQSLGEHSQVQRLKEQIKQQQKELDELRNEMKVKDQFGEIERHLENLEKRQSAVGMRKTEKEEIKSDEVSGKMNDESGAVATSMDVNDKETKKISATKENVVEKTSNKELSEIKTEVAKNKQEIEEDFLMSQLSQFSLTSSQHDNVIAAGSTQDPTQILASEHNSENKACIDDPGPPKPSRMPRTKPEITTTDKPEDRSPLETGVPIVNEESKMEVVEAAKENQPPPPKPIKQRPPPPTPAGDPQTRAEVSQVTRDLLNKPKPDLVLGDLNGKSTTSDEGDYVLQLAGELQDYRVVVDDLSRRQARGPSILTKEWLAVQHYQDTISQVQTCDVAKKNTTKNRYLDILPYDETRVILKDKEDSDYINATMIEDLTPLSPKYIASQGPIPQCFMDFWLMVWQQKCPLIVMLTREVEGKKLKCHQYWPKDEGHSMLFGSLRVTMKRQTSLPFWKERLIHITHNETHELHVVEHYQFTGWPDHGVPSNPSDFFTFMGHIYIRHQTIDPDVKRPILLHCSAGVGRTGAFIVIYSAMREMYSGNGIMDVQTLVKKLREKRKYMVQKKEQYEFCYKGILYCAEQFLIIENSTNIAEADSCDSISSSDDTCSSSSDDESFLKPVLPQRPHVSQNQKEISGTINESKQSDKGDSEKLDSGHASKEHSKTTGEDSVESDSHAQKCEMISKASDRTSKQCDENPEKMVNAEADLEKVETGNTLNNFLEICMKSIPDDSILPEIRDEEINEGGVQESNIKITNAENSGKESSSSKGSDMGETKYKEITEEPEPQVADSGVAESENTGNAGNENASVIPGLQEIQEGQIDNNYDRMNDEKHDIAVKNDIPVKNGDIKDTSEEIVTGDVEILEPESSHGTFDVSLEDGLTKCDVGSLKETTENIGLTSESDKKMQDTSPETENQ